MRIPMAAWTAALATQLLTALPVTAGEWEILYMADTGGSRLWQTDDPAEATEIVARIVSPDFAVLLTSCRSAEAGMSYLSVGQYGEVDGPTFLSETSQIEFRVDDKQSHVASQPEFFQGSFDVMVPDALLRDLAAGARLVMTYGPDSYQRKIFSLQGSTRALNAVDCNP